MGKGTRSFGKMASKKTHIVCRRCGKHSFHVRRKICASCGFGFTAKIRSYNWAKIR